MEKKLFVYGTLRSQKVFKRVTSRDFYECFYARAVLLDHKAYYVEGENYPGTRRVKGESLTGDIVWASAQVLESILRYEGEEEYELRPVSVETEKKTEQVEFFSLRSHVPLSGETWNFFSWKDTVDLAKYFNDMKNFLN